MPHFLMHTMFTHLDLLYHVDFCKAKQFKDPKDGRAFFSFVDQHDGIATKLMKVVGIDPEFLTRKINLDLRAEERSVQGGMAGTIDLQ